MIENKSVQFIYDCINKAQQIISEMQKANANAILAVNCYKIVSRFCDETIGLMSNLENVSILLQKSLKIDDVVAGKTCENDAKVIKDFFGETKITTQIAVSDYIAKMHYRFNLLRDDVEVKYSLFKSGIAEVNEIGLYPTFPTIPDWNVNLEAIRWED